MLGYAIRRLLVAVPLLLMVTVITFLLIHWAPGDPVNLMLGDFYTEERAAHVRKELGLDRSMPEQYLMWLGRAVSGDFGTSYMLRQPVSGLLAEKLPTTATLAMASLIVALLIGVPVGIMSATKRNSVIDVMSRIVAMIGVSMPVFWLGILLLCWVATRVKFFPTGGAMSQYGFRAMILPALALGFSMSAVVMRVTRSSILEELPADYVGTARSKGLREGRVLYKHVLRNALLPIITIVGFQLGYLLGGAVLTETVFTLPGLGRLFVNAINARDYPIVQTCMVLFSVVFIGMNLLVDLCYGFIDPRVKYT